uniref:hypothetical protein n=1 Tax=Azospirillum argentinense TaxID=2970906 RepID=UPI003569A07E
MVLFAAAFSAAAAARRHTMTMVSGGVLTGFVLFVMTDVIRTFGISETIPLAMAAWSPACVSVLLGTARCCIWKTVDADPEQGRRRPPGLWTQFRSRMRSTIPFTRARGPY